MKPTLLFIAAFLLCITFSRQGHAAASVNAPIDSLTKKALMKALDAFLLQKEGDNDKNKFVLKEDRLATYALLDEMKGVEKNPKAKDVGYYKAYLTNIVDLSNTDFLIQLSYIAINDKAALLRASYRFMAKKVDTQFYFFSSLKQNTATWKSKKINNINFHFKDTLDQATAKDYLKTVNSFDKRLKQPPAPFEFYFCDNFPDALQILGVDYKSNLNGVKYNDITSHDNNATLELDGGYTDTRRFDAHDLWHERLHRVMPVDEINRPVDEGCAYLYGGSWGISWPEILATFKKYATDHPDADWQKLYTDNTNLTDGDKSLKIPYAINALIVQKIEREKGFDPVMALLGCGKHVPGDDNYFTALEKVTGITKVGFNQAVWGVIKQ
jgi:hypothetical protein